MVQITPSIDTKNSPFFRLTQNRDEKPMPWKPTKADLERQARLIRKAGNRLKFDQKICEACGQLGFYGRVFKTHGHMHFAKCGCGAIGHIHE